MSSDESPFSDDMDEDDYDDEDPYFYSKEYESANDDNDDSDDEDYCPAVVSPSCWSRDMDRVTFTMQGFPKKCLQGMNELREEGVLCDVTIQVEERSFNVHRLVLVLASSYFKDMFTKGWREATQPTIQIKGVNADVMGALVNFAYTGRVQIDERNVCPLLSTASMLQFGMVVEGCCAFLKRQLNRSNCIGIAHFALQHGCMHLHRSATTIIYRQFLPVSYEEEFLELSMGHLKSLLESKDLRVVSESHVLEAVLRWVTHDESSRRCSLSELLPVMRLHLLSPSYIRQQMDSSRVLSNVPQCRDYLLSVLKDITGERNYNVKERKPPMKPAVFCVGSRDGFPNSVEYMRPTQRWFSTSHILPNSRTGHGAALLEGKLYVIGSNYTLDMWRATCKNHDQKGCPCFQQQREAPDRVDCYDPFVGAWSFCAYMPLPRSRLAVAVLDGLLYAVGGCDGGVYYRAVDRFDPKCKRWTGVAEMVTDRSDLGVAVVRRLLYAVGGNDGDWDLSSAEVYNPDCDCWSPIAPMNTKRSKLAVVALDGYVYAMGGEDSSGPLSSVERYDPERNVWEFVESMTYARSGLAAVSTGRKIYAIGGSDGTRSLASVEVFNLKTRKWVKGASMNFPRSGHVAAAGCWLRPVQDQSQIDYRFKDMVLNI